MSVIPIPMSFQNVGFSYAKIHLCIIRCLSSLFSIRDGEMYTTGAIFSPRPNCNPS